MDNETLVQLQEQFAKILMEPMASKAITERQQYKFLFTLEETADFTESFFFCAEMPDFTITHKHGLGTWLGIEAGFNMQDYINLLHPIVKKQQVKHAQDTMLAYAKGEGNAKIEFGKPLFYVIQPLFSHRFKQFMLVKRLVFPFQYYGNQLSSYLNYFTVISPLYNNEDLSFHSLYPGHGEIQRSMGQLLGQRFLEYVDPTSRRLLEMYILKSAISTKEAAEKWGAPISIDTIEDYNRRILKAAKNYFTHPFKSAKEVGEHLSGLVILTKAVGGHDS